MKFPRTNKELHQIFLSSSSPQIQELEGEYLVDMLNIPASRQLFPDSKIFYLNRVGVDHRIVGELGFEEDMWDNG